MEDPKISYEEFRALVMAWMETTAEMKKASQEGYEAGLEWLYLLRRYFDFAGRWLHAICTEGCGGSAN